MEGPYITIKTKINRSEVPEDNFFALLFRRMKEKGSRLAALLEEINRSPEKKSIISEALIRTNHDWLDLQDLDSEQPEVAQSFGNLLAQWDSLLDGKQKTAEDHIREAVAFAEML